MTKPFSISEILTDAWTVAKQNIWILIGFTAVQFVVMFLCTAFLAAIFGESTAGALLQNVIINLIDAFITVAMYQVFFKLLDEDGPIEFPDLIPNLMKALNFLLVKLIMGLVAVVLIAVLAGIYFANTPHIDMSNPFSWETLPIFILIALPLLYFTVRLCFVVCFIVDQDSGASESISQSWTVTKNHFWMLLGLFLVIFAINILGAIALFIGLLFTVPFSSLLIVIAYRHIVNEYTDEEELFIDQPENEA